METLVWHEHQFRVKYWKNIILSCAHRRKRWLQLSFNWPLTWDFPMADAHSMERGEQLKRSNLNGIVQSKFRLRHTVHYRILLADAQWPASLFCTHDSAWWLQMSFNNWPLTWDFPMADAHSTECGEQLKRSNLNGIVQLKFCLRHTVHDWILLAL